MTIREQIHLLVDAPSVLRPLWFPCFMLPWAMSHCQHTPHRVSGAQDPDEGGDGCPAPKTRRSAL